MAVQKLTKRVVDSTKPGPVNRFVWDSDVTGFGLKLTPAGKRVYVVQYRALSGPTKRVTLGTHGALTTEQARALAKQTLADVAKGKDPAAERSTQRAAPTVADMGGEFLGDVDSHRKPTTATEYRRLWNKHVVRALGASKVQGVSTADVRKLHRSLKATPYVANRVLALLGSAFTFAETEGLRAKNTNPAHEVAPFPERSRERFLTPDEVRRLGDVLRVAETAGLPPAPKRQKIEAKEATRKHTSKRILRGELRPANPFAVAVIRFLLLTGCREAEARTLRWEDVDLDRGFLKLRDTKTGDSTRALSAPAAQLLAELPRFDGSPYVFPGRTDGQPLKDISRFWDAVRHAAEIEDVRLHDLRHSFASTSALGGDSLLVIGKLLGHRNARTTAKYAHLGDDPVKAAADRTGSALASLLEGSNTKVTPLVRERSA